MRFFQNHLNLKSTLILILEVAQFALHIAYLITGLRMLSILDDIITGILSENRITNSANKFDTL